MFCSPIIAKATEEAIEKINQASSKADIFEIRLDLMDAFNIKSIFQSAGKKFLVTYRAEKKTGLDQLADPETRTKYLLEAIEHGADYVDVELSMPKNLRKKIVQAKADTKIVISTHINNMTPSKNELGSIFNDSVSAGADVVKIITWADKWEDNLRVLELITDGKKKDIDVIAFCMGPVGRISRIFSLLLGALFSFTSLETGQESASGQIPEQEMKRMVKYFQETKIN